MEYHPAQKEVRFQYTDGVTTHPISETSRLYKYQNQAGQFVLQDQGDAFFDDISYFFNGSRLVHLDVLTTEMDFQDLKAMADFYNKNHEVQIDVTQDGFLPDMNKVTELVRQYAHDTIEILKEGTPSFVDNVASKNHSVSELAQTLKEEIEHEMNNLQSKLDSLDQGTVNLCFTGAYSVGKSALINALLGYPILPENLNSETARMFRIQSPKPGDPIRISFTVDAQEVEVVWHEDKQKLVFEKEPKENQVISKIKSILNGCRSMNKAQQIQTLLKSLNEAESLSAAGPGIAPSESQNARFTVDSSVTSDVEVYFPIPLDAKGKNKFAIYDTPGSDSDHQYHETVLRKALEAQTNSILIFVASPTKLEGEGNNALLGYLRDAEEKNSRTAIDIARSMFVINQADMAKASELPEIYGKSIVCRRPQQTASEEESEIDFSIPLRNKKLFFTSARVAQCCVFEKNGVADSDTSRDFRYIQMFIEDELFKHNHSGLSEYGTTMQKQKSETALREAADRGDNIEAGYIASGVYALENEILEFGAKYASATRAYSIISSVNRALGKLQRTADTLLDDNQRELEKIESDIADLSSILKDAIRTVQSECFPETSEDRVLSEEIVKVLRLDGGSLDKEIGQAKMRFREHMWGLAFKDNMIAFKAQKDKVYTETVSTHKRFCSERLHLRTDELTRRRDSYIEKMREIMTEQGGGMREGVDFILDIDEPLVPPFDDPKERLATAFKDTTHRGFLGIKIVNRKEFIDMAGSVLGDGLEDTADKIKQDYALTSENLANVCEDSYMKNLEKYSLLLHVRLCHKEEAEALGKRICEVQDQLLERQKLFEQVVWGSNEAAEQ